MAEVDARVVRVLGVGQPAGFLKLPYVGCFGTRTWIKTYRDDSGQLRIGQCNAMARDRLVLWLCPLHSQPDDLADDAFGLDGVQRAVSDALEAYLAEHFKGRHLRLLLYQSEHKKAVGKS